jgi:hypothetical protein
MRPESIIMFERLFLASLVVSGVSFAIGYEDTMRIAASDPGMRQLGLGAGFIAGTLAVSFAIYLLLWYLIARKASRIAKWVLIVLVAIGVASLPVALAGPLGLTVWLNLAVYALEIAALVFLFRADAIAWFRGERAADPAAFD